MVRAISNNASRFAIALSFLLLMNYHAKAQDPIIKMAIENLTEKAEQEYDYSDLLDEFINLKEHPININSTESKKLIPLFLLDELLYNNIRQYIDSNGLLMSKQELLLIDGFNRQNLQYLSPFILTKAITKTKQIKPSNVFKYGKHQIFLRYQRVLQDAQGYKNRNDSTINASPNSKYLGNADKYYLKYQFKYSDRISAGFVAEKDAGEIFFENIKNPLLDSLIGDKIQHGFDFYAANIYIQNFGIVKQAVIGDYHLQFAQGLNMWSSLSFGKSSNAINTKKYARGIKPNTSTDENKFLRGAAVRLAHNKWAATVFYSSKKQDASDFINPDDQENHFLNSINGTGYHRTISELLKKNLVKVSLFGARLVYINKNLKIGISASHTQLDKEIINKPTPYQYYQFSGKENSILGFDYEFRLKMTNIFGEFSHQVNSGWAFIGGLNAPLNNRFALSLLYRNFQKDYTNLFGAAFGENTQNNNEQGIYTGFVFQLSSKLKLNAYADLFSFPWLKYRIDAPSYGSEYLAQLDYQYSRSIQMTFKLRYKSKELNISVPNQLTHKLQRQNKYSFRYHISYQLHPRLVLRNRIEYQVFETEESGKQDGFLIFQDIVFKNRNQKLSLTARFALFDIEDYDSRIYAYENDILFVFSIPAYYHRGIRTYGLVSYKINTSLQFWFKIANTWYDNIDIIGSDLNAIEGSNKTEVRLQLRIKI